MIAITGDTSPYLSLSYRHHHSFFKWGNFSTGIRVFVLSLSKDIKFVSHQQIYLYLLIIARNYFFPIHIYLFKIWMQWIHLATQGLKPLHTFSISWPEVKWGSKVSRDDDISKIVVKRRLFCILLFPHRQYK